MKNFLGLSAKKYLLSDDGSISLTSIGTIGLTLSLLILKINGMELNEIKIPLIVIDLANIGQLVFGGTGAIGLLGRLKK